MGFRFIDDLTSSNGGFRHDYYLNRDTGDQLLLCRSNCASHNVAINREVFELFVRLRLREGAKKYIGLVNDQGSAVRRPIETLSCLWRNGGFTVVRFPLEDVRGVTLDMDIDGEFPQPQKAIVSGVDQEIALRQLGVVKDEHTSCQTKTLASFCRRENVSVTFGKDGLVTYQK